MLKESRLAARLLKSVQPLDGSQADGVIGIRDPARKAHTARYELLRTDSPEAPSLAAFAADSSTTCVRLKMAHILCSFVDHRPKIGAAACRQE